MTSILENDPALTRDAFLGGRLQIWQPAKGYRAGVDAVLLAAFVDARPGQSVLELGCGVGVASLCLGSRVAGLNLNGIELQPGYAELARRNADAMSMQFHLVIGDISTMPDVLRARQFDHVIANPPYYDPARRTASKDEGREVALSETLPLSAWCDAAARRLAPRGYLSMIQKADRLPDLLTAIDDRFGDIVVQPLHPRLSRPAELVLLRARKGARGAFRLKPGIVMHDGAHHERDGDSYTAQLTDILRHGMQLKVE